MTHRRSAGAMVWVEAASKPAKQPARRVFTVRWYQAPQPGCKGGRVWCPVLCTRLVVHPRHPSAQAVRACTHRGAGGRLAAAAPVQGTLLPEAGGCGGRTGGGTAGCTGGVEPAGTSPSGACFRGGGDAAGRFRPAHAGGQVGPGAAGGGAPRGPVGRPGQAGRQARAQHLLPYVCARCRGALLLLRPRPPPAVLLLQAVLRLGRSTVAASLRRESVSIFNPWVLVLERGRGPIPAQDAAL